MTTKYSPLADTLVIGFGHKARQGKDMAAQMIAGANPTVDIVRFAFADALKAYCRVELGMTAKDAGLLQRVGVARRAKNPDVWISALYWTILERRPQVALITDMRFPNEVEMVRAMGGRTVKVERVMADGSVFRPTDRDPQHDSETALDGYDGWDEVLSAPDGGRWLRQEAIYVFDRLMGRKAA